MNRPDWIVDKLELTDKPDYPYCVTGHHRVTTPAGDFRFRWYLPARALLDNARYCLAHTQADNATWLHVAKAARKALEARMEADRG